ncbi:MAG: HNH endonuclease, partial [Proteobacteria bacterium]|nr:HNH endonuclease [Pseudomonadota bacterium]
MSPANSVRTKPISIDELDYAIVSCAAHINAATYEMLLLVRQFDERAGFLRWGLDNCAEWLAWRCDL